MNGVFEWNLLAATAAFAAVIAVFMMYYSQVSTRRYQKEIQRAQLDLFRELMEGRIYRLNDRLTATGDRFRDVNHLIMDAQYASGEETSVKPVRESRFLRGLGLQAADLLVDTRSVFVLIPFHPDYNEVFRGIREACSDLNLTATRGDEQFLESDILRHIIRQIVRARFVIAVLDGRNPNVFYELGIAHALDKPVIAVARSVEDVPFDLKSRRLVLYPSVEELQARLTKELARLSISQPE